MVCALFSVHILPLQALIDPPDVHIYNELIKDDREDTFLKGYILWACGYMYATDLTFISFSHLVVCLYPPRTKGGGG